MARHISLGGTGMLGHVVRALRNMLVGFIGKTLIAEFFIDKLYSPYRATRRIRVREMRAFEMPPHARMSCVQQLLLRAMVAWFWREPYKGHGSTRLTRWHTGLHDRFLLPHFVKQDCDDLLAELAHAGLHFDAQWFAPHFEF